MLGWHWMQTQRKKSSKGCQTAQQQLGRQSSWTQLQLLQRGQQQRSNFGSTSLGRWMVSSSSGLQQAQLPTTAALVLLGAARWSWLLLRGTMLLLRGVWPCTS
jgi:hypothetical protein